MKKKYRLHELGNIVSSYHTGCLKKQPEFFSSHIVSNLELRPEDFLYFDDNTEYLEIASKSGIKPVFCDFEHTGSAVNLLRMIEKQKTTHLRLPRNKIKVKFKDGPHAKPSYAISDFVNKMRSFNFNIEHLYLSFAFAPNYKLDLLESDFCDGQDIMGFAILLYRAVDSRVMGPDQDLIFEFYGKPIRPLISLGVLMQAVLRRTEKSYKGDNAYGKGRYLDWLDNELRRVNEVSLLSFKEIMDKIRIEIESRQKEFIGAYCLEEKDPEDVLLHIVLGNSSLLQGFDMELSDFLYAKKSFKNTDVLKKTIGYLDSYVQYLKIFVEYRHPFSEYNEDALVEACCYSFVEYITSPEGAFEEFTESKYWKNIRPAFVSHVQFLDDRLNELKEISEILKRNAKLYSANAHRRNN